MKLGRLPYRYFVLFLIALLATQIITTHLLLSRWRSQSLTEASEVARDIASYSAAALDRTISQTDALLKALPVLLRDQLQNGEVTAQALELLRAQINQNEALRNVAIIDEIGVTRASTSPGPQILSDDTLADMRRRGAGSLRLSSVRAARCSRPALRRMWRAAAQRPRRRMSLLS